MDINRANMLPIFSHDLEMRFLEGFNLPIPNSVLNQAAMMLPSNSDATVHGWLNQFPNMREWVGDRILNDIESNSLTIVNRLFEDSIRMKRTEIEDDKVGLYLPRAKILGQIAQSFRDQLLIEALVRGTTTKWADGDNVFSDTRTYGDATIDNYATTAFDEAGVAWDAIRNAMMSYRGHQGQPLMFGAPRFVIVHGPALRTKMWRAFIASQGSKLDDGLSTYIDASNPYQGQAIPVESPYLINGFVDSKGTTHNAANYWFVIVDFFGFRPLVYQDRLGPEFQSQMATNDSEYVVLRDEYVWGVRMRGEAFIALPHMVYGCFAT